MAIINNNVQNVKFLRNQTPFGTRDLARQALEDNKGVAADGTALLARYTADNDVKTLVGFVAEVNSAKHVTIFDVEGASGDVEKLREEINAKLGTTFISSGNTVESNLTALSGNSSSTSAETSVEGAKRYADELKNQMDYTGVTTGDGVYVTNVTQSDGIVSATTATLPTVATITEAGKPIIAVAEDKGQIAASAGTINAEYVNVTGDTFTATNVQGALEELDDKIDDAISGLDYSDTAVDGEYVSEVDEVDGVISVTRVALPSVTGQSEAKKVVIAVSEDKGTVSDTKGTISSSAKTIVLNDNEDGGIDFDVNIDGVTLEKDADGVISVTSSALVQYEGDTKTIAISPVEGGVRTVSTLLTLSSVTPSSTTVKEEYALKNASGETIGSTIKIYKDSSLVSIELVNEDPTQDPPKAGQFLKYTYIDASGATQSVYVDVSALLVEAEFESGVTANDAGVVHGVVDPTSESFLTVGADGFKLAGVQDAIDSAVSGLDASVSAETTHITVKIDEADGKLTAVTLTEDDIASATALTKEIGDREEADTELSNRLGTGVTTANTATAQLAALSGDPATAQSGDTSVEGAKKYADAKLDDVVGDLDADESGSTEHITVGVLEVDGKISAVTVSEDNIANADDLAELSGNTITAITSTNGSISASISNEAGNKTADIQTDADKIQMSGFSAENTTALSGISESDSIATAFEKTNAVITSNVNDLADLGERLDVVEDEYISGLSVNGKAVTVADKIAPISITAATSAATATSTEAIVVDTDANGNITLGIANIDCGYYDGTQG